MAECDRCGIMTEIVFFEMAVVFKAKTIFHDVCVMKYTLGLILQVLHKPDPASRSTRATVFEVDGNGLHAAADELGPLLLSFCQLFPVDC